LSWWIKLIKGDKIMPYKISGALNDSARILVLKESDWSIESNSLESVGDYEVTALVSGVKTIVSINNSGEIIGYGNVNPTYYPPVPAKAISPSPSNGLTDQDIDVDISWQDGAGGYATSYDVYFGIDATPDESEFKGNQEGTNYDPGTLEKDGTYYWRIDSKNETGTTTGDIWYFETVPSYTAGDRGLFGGDNWEIEYIAISSTGNAGDFGNLSLYREKLAATSNGTNDRGVFGGGSMSANRYNIIDYVTVSTTGNASDFGDLASSRQELAASSNGTSNRGVFGGGTTDISLCSNIIEYITISSTGNASDFGDLVEEIRGTSATSNATNNRGIFGGGVSSSASKFNTIEYITISSTGNTTDFGDLLSATYVLAASSNGTSNRGVFGGGDRGTTTNVITYVTISSTGNATDFGDLTAARRFLAATSNGTDNRGVFGGGYTTAACNIIDYITISSTGNATDFGDLRANKYDIAATSDA
jgi:hypothetical protein